MKTILKFTTLTAVLLILAISVTGCNKRSECECQDLMKNAMAGDCMEYSFFETLGQRDSNIYPFYSEYRDNVFSPLFLVKGVASDAIEYGRRIRLVEDLIGNFPENVNNSFIAWGAGNFMHVQACSRVDHLAANWENGDTLLMLLFPHFEDETERARKYLEDIGRSECIPVLLIEKPGDYTTLPGHYSVVKLSGDFVVGRSIFPEHQGQGLEWKSVPRKEFFERLQEILNSKPPNN